MLALPRRLGFVPQIGFTLVELVIVVVVLGIMSAYAVMKGFSPAEMSLPSQAQKMASDIRHAQTLAYTQGRSLSFIAIAATPGRYCVTTSGPTDCTEPVADPATGNLFDVPLQKGVGLTGTGKLVFNSLGQPTQPTAGARYTLGSTVTVCVAALTGFVKVSPPDTCP